MTKYHTNNPLGSTDPRDLYDNAQNLDAAVNDTANDTWKDRFGRERVTLKGYDSAFQQFLIDSGYVNIGDYGPGLEITARNQIFWRDGELYRAGAALELPYTTTGDWGDEESLFVVVGDQSLRQQLADSTDPENGAGMVGFIQDSTTARARTALDKMRDSVHVRDFEGVVGDGVHDDIEGLEAARDYAKTHKLKLNFSGAVCRVSRYLMLDGEDVVYDLRGGEIRGAGGGVVTDGWGVVFFAGRRNTFLGGRVITQYKGGTPGGSGGENGVSLLCEDSLVDGLLVDCAVGWRGIDIQVDADHLNPIFQGRTCKNTVITNCTTIGGDTGFDLIMAGGNIVENVVFSNCTAIDANYGLLVTATDNNLNIKNLTVSNFQAVRPRAFGASIKRVDGLLIDGLRVDGTSHRGLDVQQISNHDIRNVRVTKSSEPAPEWVTGDAIGVHAFESGWELGGGSASGIHVSGDFVNGIRADLRRMAWNDVHITGASGEPINRPQNRNIYFSDIYLRDCPTPLVAAKSNEVWGQVWDVSTGTPRIVAGGFRAAYLDGLRLDNLGTNSTHRNYLIRGAGGSIEVLRSASETSGPTEIIASILRDGDYVNNINNGGIRLRDTSGNMWRLTINTEGGVVVSAV